MQNLPAERRRFISLFPLNFCFHPLLKNPLNYCAYILWRVEFTVFLCLIFRHRASCILGQAFHYSPENAFHIYFINKYISLSDICLTVHH